MECPVQARPYRLIRRQVFLGTSLGLALLICLAMALSACAGDPVRTAETPATQEPAPTLPPTPDIPATVLAVLTRVAATPAANPDVPATVTAALATLAETPTAAPPAEPPAAVAPVTPTPTPPPLPPSPEPSLRSISDVVQSIDAGLFQIITPDATGSGFLVSDQGHVVTNAHVVGQHASVTVRSASGQMGNARVLGKDATLDLAVLLAESWADAIPMPLGSASSIMPGDEVIALGFPLGNDLGRDYTVTTGVVSSRRVRDSVERIQTDAAVNPGNSGGPLINRKGEVIGVNTSALADYDGISFAISVSEVKASLDALIAGEGVVTEVSARWRTYKNPDCQYQLLVHPDWTLNEVAEPCRVRVERYADDALVGTVNIVAYDLNDGETLSDFAGRWRDALEERAGQWEGFEILSFEQLHVGSPGYLLDFRWWETNADCAATGTALIVRSKHLPKALVFSAGVCDFAPDTITAEVVAMDLRY